MIIGRLVINLTGSVHLERTVTAISKPEQSVDLFSERTNGSSYKVGTLDFPAYVGTTHDVHLTRTACQQVIPVTQDMWRSWTSSAPSFAELKKLGNGYKSQLKKFLGQTEYNKGLAHARDMAFDISGREDSFHLELN